MTASGEVERVVAVVVMYVSRPDGCILVQLGKWDDDTVYPDCQLPAVKRERNELSEEAAQRLLSTKLAPLQGCTQLLHVEREIAVGDSRVRAPHEVHAQSVFRETDLLL